MNNYFKGFATQCITVPCESTVKPGYAVKLDSDSTAALASQNADFVAVCNDVRGEYATIVLKGYTELSYTGTDPGVGYIGLVYDTAGKVKVDAENGRKMLVVCVDTTDKKIGIIL